MGSAAGQTFMPPPYQGVLPTATIVTGRVCASPSSTSVSSTGRSRASSARTATSYRRRPFGQRSRLARSETAESKPQHSTVAHQRSPVRPASIVREAPEARSSAAARAAAAASAGMPSARTRSLPVPAGTTASAADVPGHGLDGGVHRPVAADGDDRAGPRGDGLGGLPLGVGARWWPAAAAASARPTGRR